MPSSRACTLTISSGGPANSLSMVSASGSRGCASVGESGVTQLR